MLSEDRINQNYLIFIKKLEAYGCYSEEMMQDMGECIKYASYTRHDDYGGCYDGSLIDVTLHTLCRIGFEINEKAFGRCGDKDAEISHPYLAVNTNKLMRVLLLLNIAKADMFVPETEQWKIKRGQMYSFKDFDTSMRLGERTLFLCQKYGIVLDEDEYEAILATDEETNGERFRTPLYTLVKATKAFTMVELRMKKSKE